MSFQLRIVAAVVAALLNGAIEGRAQPAQPPRTDEPDQVVSALVAEALANNPDLLVAAESVTAAEARPEQARALPDPMVSAQYTNDGWAPTLGRQEMTTLAFMASQTLPWPGKRSVRAAIARSDTAQARERVERARLTVAAAVKRAFWGLALARETLGLLAEQRDVWKNAEAVTRGRYVVGQGAQQDVLRAQVEITRYEQLRAEQEAELAVRAAELNRLLNRPADAPAPQTPRLALRPRQADLAALWAEAEARSPELRAAAVGREREELALRLAQKDFRPDVTLQAGYMNRGGLDPMWQAGVGVNLPVFRGRRRAAVAEAEARGRGAARQVEAVRAQLRYRTQERAVQLRTAETLVRLYDGALVPQARLAYEASIASYQAGRAPFLTVLEALSSLYTDRASQLRVVATHERIKASLDEASLEATSEMPASGAAAMGSPAGALSGGAQMGGGATGSPAPPAAMSPMGQ
jgi:outer membrane protein TolC